MNWPGMWKHPKTKWNTRSRGRGENSRKGWPETSKPHMKTLECALDLAIKWLLGTLARVLSREHWKEGGLQWTEAVRK